MSDNIILYIYKNYHKSWLNWLCTCFEIVWWWVWIL